MCACARWACLRITDCFSRGVAETQRFMRATRVIPVLLATVLLADSTFACSCTIRSLSKRFRQSEAIFVGRLAGQSVTNTNVQNFGANGPILEVTQSFKGISKKYVAINLNFEEISKAGMCPLLVKFDEGAEYLIFAYGNNLTINSVCSDSRKSDAIAQADIKKLHSFWFRTSARLWPF